MKKLLLVIVTFHLLSSCNEKKLQDGYGTVLVQIENKKLYSSEVENIIHDETSVDDSTAIANAYIDRWIQDQLMIRDAHRYLSSDFEIEQLVEDYRNNLIKYRYEKEIIKKNMNPDVTDNDLQIYYEKYKRNYILSEAIYKIIFASIPGNSEKIDKFYNAWLNNEFDYISAYCAQNADTLVLGNDEWVNANKIAQLVPKTLIKGQKLSSNKTIQKNINNNEYFLKILDMKPAKDTIPLDLLKDKIGRLVLHERKKETIENYKQEIFDKGMRSKIVKIDIQ